MADLGSPASLHAVELQQVSRCRGTSLDLVQVDDLEAVFAPGVITRALGCAQRGPERQATDPPHSLDANPHVALYPLPSLHFDMSLDIEMTGESIMSTVIEMTRW